MAKGYDKGRRPRGTFTYGSRQETRLTQRLGEIVSDLYLCTDDRDIARLWNSAKRALLQTNTDKLHVDQVIAQRRIGALAKLVNELTSANKPTLRPTTSATESDDNAPNVVTMLSSIQVPTPSAPASISHSGPADSIKAALKAFRKRLKLTRLNEESKLGRSPMSAGKKSAVLAIMPPREYSQAVWDELVKQGKLRDTGGGFYELVGE